MTKTVFTVRRIPVKHKCLFSDFLNEYYILWNDKYPMGDPMTRHHAQLISKWLNSVDAEDLYFHINKDKDNKNEKN